MMGIERKEAVPGLGVGRCLAASRLSNGLRLVYEGGAVELRRKEDGSVVAEWPDGRVAKLIAEGDGFGADRFLKEMEREAFGKRRNDGLFVEFLVGCVISAVCAVVLWNAAVHVSRPDGAPSRDAEGPKVEKPADREAGNRALDEVLSGKYSRESGGSGGAEDGSGRDSPPNPEKLDPDEIPLPGEADRDVEAETAPDAPEDVADKTDAAERPSVDDVINEMDAMRKEMDAEAVGSGSGGSGEEASSKSGGSADKAGSIALPGGGDIDSPDDLREFGLEP